MHTTETDDCRASAIREKQREARKKHRAELRWLELAVAERGRLVAGMEAVERENEREDMFDAGSMSLTNDADDDEIARSIDE